jgi:hypothetical protein
LGDERDKVKVIHDCIYGCYAGLYFWERYVEHRGGISIVCREMGFLLIGGGGPVVIAIVTQNEGLQYSNCFNLKQRQSAGEASLRPLMAVSLQCRDP